MKTRIALLVLSCAIALPSAAQAITLHLDMTPELTGSDGFEMRPLGNKRTRFTIRRSTADDPQPADSQFPFVRGGVLKVYGDDGLIMRCPIEPRTDKSGQLIYSFELKDRYARNAFFILSEFEDNQQVGGGSVYSYRLIDFIDPGYRYRELLRTIETPNIDDLIIRLPDSANSNDNESPAKSESD